MKDDLEHYKNFDFSQAKLVKPEIIKKLQARHAEAQAKVLDADVVTWLSTQDPDTKKHINEVIRHFMAVKTA
jgi:uncharacterized protein (DUF4415 family)